MNVISTKLWPHQLETYMTKNNVHMIVIHVFKVNFKKYTVYVYMPNLDPDLQFPILNNSVNSEIIVVFQEWTKMDSLNEG